MRPVFAYSVSAFLEAAKAISSTHTPPPLPVVFWIACDEMDVDYGLHNIAWFFHRIVLRVETAPNPQLTRRQPKVLVQCIFFHE